MAQSDNTRVSYPVLQRARGELEQRVGEESLSQLYFPPTILPSKPSKVRLFPPVRPIEDGAPLRVT
jgi:hypothetical protein